MKILFIASDNKASGAFRSMAKLTQLLIEKYGVEVLVILPRNGEGQKLLEENGVPFKLIKSSNWIYKIKHDALTTLKVPLKIIKNLFAVRSIEKVIDSFQPDIVHINTSYSYVGLLAGQRKRKPVVWHIREYLEEDQDSKMWNRKIGYRVMGRATRLVAISQDLCNKYKRLVGAESIQVIYNGIDTEQYYNPQKQIFTNSTAYLLCVGSLNPGKGQKVLIDACAEIVKRGKENFVLHLVGSGREEENLRKQVKALSLENNVVFEGYQPNAVGFYQAADIVFMTSRSEAFGRVTVEAMLGGALVIGSNSGATPELLGGSNEHGYLYALGDAKDLADKIEYVLDHREEARRTMMAGRDMAYHTFSAEKNAEEIYRMYHDVLKAAVIENSRHHCG